MNKESPPSIRPLVYLVAISFILFSSAIILYEAQPHRRVSALSVPTPDFSVGPQFSATINQTLVMEQTMPSYVYVAVNNTLVFESLQPHVVILTSGRSTLSRFNITTGAFPSWVHGPIFIVYGHVDPTLVFLSGAQVNAQVINIDGDMLHSFALAPVSYKEVSFASIPSLMFRSYLSNSTIVVHGASITFKLPAGSYEYFSLVSGQNQAQSFGMYGKIESVTTG